MGRRARWGLAVATALVLLSLILSALPSAAALPSTAFPASPQPLARAPLSSSASTSPPAAGALSAPASGTAVLASLDAAVNRTSALAVARLSATPVPAHPLPAGTGMGYFTGYVNDSVNHTGIAGVSVQAFSKYQNCQVSNCTIATTKTSPSGYFQVNALVGYDYVTFTLNCWMTNITWGTIAFSGQTVYLGTIYLTQDGVVNGTVRSDAPNTPGIGSVHVTVSTRDANTNGPPAIYSQNKGQFLICVPVAASKLDFQATFGYLENFTWVNVPSKARLNLGNVYLEPEITYKAVMYDRITGKTINMGAARMGAMKICARDGSGYAGVCGEQGNTMGSGPLYRSGTSLLALGPIGPVYAQIDVAGYVANYTEIGTVTKASLGKVFCLGSVNGTTCGKTYLTPISGFDLQVSVEHNANTPLPGNWGQGLWRATDCGLAGYDFALPTLNPATYTYNMSESTCLPTQGCLSPGGTAVIAALPLHNSIAVEPDYTTACSYAPTWPIPGSLPVYGTHLWVNTTAGSVTGNYKAYLVPGDYVQGNLSLVVNGAATAAGGFTVTATSVDFTGISPTSYSYTWAGANSQFTSPWMCTGSQSARNFCAPIPPGNSQVQIVSSGNLPTNWTWVSGPTICCNKYSNGSKANNASYPEWLSRSNVLHSGAIDFSLGNDTVVGKVVIRGTSLAPGFGSVTVCPALPLLAYYACASGPLFTNGTFRLTGAAPGWDSIQVSASGFSPNSVWADVGGYTNIGNISLVPVATLYGRVLGPNGQAVTAAQVYWCTADSSLACTVGAGTKLAVQVATDGTYNGSVAGGWLPWSTYLISVTAPGYTTDWAWVNGTIGNFTQVPDLTLYPTVNATNNSPSANSTNNGQSGTGSLSRPAGSGSAGIIWVDGRVSDLATGIGIYQARVQACPTNLGACSSFSDGTNSYGAFNGSVTPGAYNLLVSQPGYPTLSIGFSATSGPVVHLGNSTMYPGGWVRGQVMIAPLEWNLFASEGLGPGLLVQACDNHGSNCGTASRVNTGGFYNVSVPFNGATGTIKFIAGPVGTAAGASAGTYQQESFYTPSVGFTLTGRYSVANNGTAAVAYSFGQVSGRVLELAPGGGVKSPPFGVRYATVSVTTFGGPLGNAGVAEVADDQGYYTAYVPEGNSSNAVVITSTQFAYNTAQLFFNNTIIPWGTTNTPPNATLTHDGWVDFNITALSAPAPFVGGTASTFDIKTGGTIGGPSSSANEVGFMNLSAPAGSPVNVSLVGNGYNGTNFSVAEVNASATTWAPPADVSAWGMVRSADVNNSGVPISPVVGAIYDAAKGWPLPGAGVTAGASDGVTTGQTAQTNWAGQFITDAPIGKSDQLSVTHSAYAKNTSVLTDVSAGTAWISPRINLTGAGILAGLVIGYPGHIPIGGATVTACPQGTTASAGCYSTTTNLSGVFWVDASAGTDNLEFQADGYVSNSTTVVTVCSDCWVALAPTPLYAYAVISGTILGLPSGLPLKGASASLCSPIGVPYGPCSVNSTTNSTGNFVISAPPGPYVLVGEDAGYNASFFPIALLPGQNVNVGYIFLQSYGTIVGQVYSTPPSIPIKNATVLACPTWSTGACLPTVRTNALGQFSIGGPPGAYTMTIAFPGYADAFLTVSMVAGTTQSLPTVYLEPLGNGTLFTVSGHVVSGAASGGPIRGATVSALVGGSVAASVQSGPSGDFSLGVYWGVYTIQASYSGFQAVQRQLTVHQSYPGLTFVLPPMTYNLSGVVRDGVTGLPLGNVTISLNSTDVAASAANGSYSVALTNGTYALTAYTFGGQYATVDFTVVVNGAPVTRDVAMFPPVSPVNGLVVDELSGLPLSGATVHVQGTTSDNQAVDLTLHPDVTGRVSFTLPEGNYHLTATAPGYSPTVTTLNATGEPLALTVSLAPTSGGSSAGVSPTALPIYGLLGAVAVVGLLLAVLALRRPRPPRRTGAPRPSTGPATPIRRG